MKHEQQKIEYIMVDGREQYARREMSDAEYEEANRNANIVTDGNIWWEPADKHNAKYPQNEDYRYN